MVRTSPVPPGLLLLRMLQSPVRDEIAGRRERRCTDELTGCLAFTRRCYLCSENCIELPHWQTPVAGICGTVRSIAEAEAVPLTDVVVVHVGPVRVG